PRYLGEVTLPELRLQPRTVFGFAFISADPEPYRYQRAGPVIIDPGLYSLKNHMYFGSLSKGLKEYAYQLPKSSSQESHSNEQGRRKLAEYDYLNYLNGKGRQIPTVHRVIREDGINLLTVIKDKTKYRQSWKHDFVKDYFPPSMSEYKSALEGNGSDLESGERADRSSLAFSLQGHTDTSSSTLRTLFSLLYRTKSGTSATYNEEQGHKGGGAADDLPMYNRSKYNRSQEALLGGSVGAFVAKWVAIHSSRNRARAGQRCAFSVPITRVVTGAPTIILRMDVSHGFPSQSDVPSIAAVVSSRHYPLISRYRAPVRTQSPKVEMIDSLFKKVSDTEDDGIMRELLLDFYVSSAKPKPDQIIIFWDGVSESQFNQVLNIELDQIIEACKFLDEKWCPKFLVIIAQKNHHTKFFQPGSPDNAPPGTVIDNNHPRNNDFYMCAHARMIGTTRPTHYHVLYDEIGFSADDLQELVHSLSYVTTAISVVAPICYAHLAATQVGQFMKFEDHSETSSNHGGVRICPYHK
ncbi:argonaute 4-like protein, partial [Tanacetum coccineum]